MQSSDRPTNSENGWSWRVSSVLLTLIVFVLFALTRSENLAISHDSSAYLANIEQGGQKLFHQHHLLFNAVGAAWLWLMQLLGTHSDAAMVVPLINCLFGALGSGMIFLLIGKRGGVPPTLAAIGAIGATVSFGYWFYSVCIEVYIFPLFFLLTTLYVVLAPRLSLGHIAGVGFLHGLAMLGHQIHFLFGLVLLSALWIQRSKLELSPIRTLFTYLLSGASVVLLGYGSVLAFAIRPSSLYEAWEWFTLYAQKEHYWNTLSLTTVVKAFMGLSRSIVGGHFVFAIEPIRELVEATFPDKSLRDELFLVRNFSSFKATFLLVSSAIVGLCFSAIIVRGGWQHRRISGPARTLATVMSVWILCYSIFFLFWEPYNVEFWIPQTTALWVLAVTLTSSNRQAAHRVRHILLFGSLALLLFIVNLFGSILPAGDRSNDFYAHQYTLLATYVQEGDLILVDHPHISVGYASRYTHAEPLSLITTAALAGSGGPNASTNILIRRFEQAIEDGHSVYVESTLLNRGETSDQGTVVQQLHAHFADRWDNFSMVDNLRYFVIKSDEE